ncbi:MULTISPECIES: hypothetical protein [Flavobacterium]|jgi:hypothetical protein|uniref:Phosphatidate cytidylyltransferase n=1 Tax=Flavobacterium johnsoniae TaxID=986 RepID=A0A1M5IB48_FLAJO|nr:MULTISPECIES: hypothetical protein [Flavobacterium]WDF58287.1 hypothetical protein PQ462_16345 [Flavobacterium sp. KACC 22758]WQG80614.1 hypothetical protein SR927_21655 [Flavobacterium johnsoniae UW101]SHG25481.1 hypothetical protein SAMN05444388_10219 [Flavobacterium johnsoniae]SHL09580.1 hypothetical protein SAMN05444146_2940 [Flavobacterium johnsoniae]
MQNKITRLLMVFVILFSFTSCELVGDIFKAGMGFGIFIVIFIVAIVIWILAKVFGSK